MSDTNCLVMSGRLTRDSETKYSNSGNPICTFSLATNKYKGGEEVAHFFDCVLFGKSAESLGQHLTKGKQIVLQGEIEQNRWEDSDGTKRSKVGIVAYKIQLLGSNKQENDYV